jgi:hypothetical protein
LTPKTVLPTFFILGILFAPIGGLLVWGSGQVCTYCVSDCAPYPLFPLQVTEITIDYTNCEDQPSTTPNPDANVFHDVSSYSYKLKSGQDGSAVKKPQYAFIDQGEDNRQCVIRFDIPYDLPHTVLLYYKLTNFFQNHRRYVKSLNTDQLNGKAKSADDLNSDGNCKPLATLDNKPIYPCGLIANSMFNGE